MILKYMKAKALIIGCLLLIAGGAVFRSFSSKSPSREAVVILGTPAPPLPELNPESVALGQSLYAQYCATCHGADLKGAPNWKTPLEDGSLPPPPQDSSGHTWHHADGLILEIIASGGDPAINSRMPAFDGRLSKTEMMATLDFIKSKWGIEERQRQWWVTATQQ